MLTSWQPRDPAHSDVPAKLRTLDLPALLADAGFTVATVEDRPDLMTAQATIFDAALASRSDDPALTDLREEATLVATWPTTMRRLLLVATNPT